MNWPIAKKKAVRSLHSTGAAGTKCEKFGMGLSRTSWSEACNLPNERHSSTEFTDMDFLNSWPVMGGMFVGLILLVVLMFYLKNKQSDE